MRSPIKKFAEQEGVSVRFLYNEAAAGRLDLTKVGSRTFVDDGDAEKWRALATKVTGKRGHKALEGAEQKLRELGTAVEQGQLDRAVVVTHLAEIARKTGLVLDQAA